MRRLVLKASVALSALLLAGCSTAGVPDAGGSSRAASPTSAPTPPNRVVAPEDAQAFAQLERVAPSALKLDGGRVEVVRCWTPSEHLFNDASVASKGTWKVVCRVFYDLHGTDRYQDATCIGDFDAKPMLDHCYVWEYYSYEATFADGAKLSSPPPSPLP